MNPIHLHLAQISKTCRPSTPQTTRPWYLVITQWFSDVKYAIKQMLNFLIKYFI
jgi:hypothetical protein